MRKLLLTTFVAFICANVFAQTMMPIPAQTSTFSGNVRGYYFTAPTCFTITGVRVPTDANSGNQSIAIVRLNAVPPLYSTTTNSFTVLYLTQNNTNTGILPVNIQVEQGDVIGILGQRATVCSYAPGPTTTTIAGFPVTIARLGMQFSLTTTPPQDLWTEASGNISRVEMYYDSTITYTASASVLNASDVQFTSNADTSFTSVWDFGDGSPLATIDNPLHTYALAGIYTACTYITNSCGTDTICMSVTVCGSAVTTANYTSTTMGAVAMFTDASSATTSWFWYFGDSGTSTLQSPTHTYAASGTYTVCLIATNGSCGVDTICNTVTVCIPPTVTFTSTAMGNGTVMFSETSTGANSWSWDYGDGSPIDTGMAPMHTYSASGTYVVCVTANGCSSATTCDTITVCLPASAFYTYVDANGVIQFTDVSANATSWSWYFGDATSSSQQNPQHTYTVNGTYNVCLIAADCDADTICTQVTTCPEVLSASFTSNDSALTANFTSTSNSAASYLWDFGDGNQSTAQNPTHNYSNTGLYTVCLTTWNICGDSTSSCDTVLIVITDGLSIDSHVEFGVFPNPMTDASVVIVNSSEYSGAYTFEMVDASGKLVRTQNGLFNQPMNVNRGDLADGVYFYTIKVNNVQLGNGKLVLTK